MLKWAASPFAPSKVISKTIVARLAQAVTKGTRVGASPGNVPAPRKLKITIALMRFSITFPLPQEQISPLEALSTLLCLGCLRALTGCTIHTKRGPSSSHTLVPPCSWITLGTGENAFLAFYWCRELVNLNGKLAILKATRVSGAHSI